MERKDKPFSEAEIDDSNRHSELIVLSIIDKLISYSITDAQNNRVEQQIPFKCWDFTKKIFDNFIKLEFMPIDRDDIYMSKELINLVSKESKAIGLEQLVNTIPKDLQGLSSNKFGVEFNKPANSIKYSDMNLKVSNQGSKNIQSLDSINESGTETQNINFVEKDGSKITPMYKKDQEINYIQKNYTLERNNTNENIYEQNMSILGEENLPEKIGKQNNLNKIQSFIACKIDRAASSVIKVTKNIFKDKDPLNTKDEKIDQSENETRTNFSKTNYSKFDLKDEKETRQLSLHSIKADSNLSNITNQKKRNYQHSELPNFPIEPENLYERDEEKEIDDLRKMKKEEWRRKEEEAKNKIKIDKEIKEKEIEVTRKQKEFERKNVTTDLNGNIMFIKNIAIDKLNSDFVNPKFDIKNKGEISNVLSMNKDIKDSSKEVNLKNERSTLFDRFNQSKKENRLKERDKVNAQNKSGIGKTELANSSIHGAVILPVVSNGQITLQPLTLDRMERAAITPAGSSFGLIMPEIGVTVIEGGQSKFGGGGREYFKAFKKYSKYDYQTMLRDSGSTFGQTMKDFNIESLNNEYDMNKRNDILPNIAYRTRQESFLNVTHTSKNSGSGTLKFNQKIGGSLRNALENLDEIAEPIIPEDIENNSNLFKNNKREEDQGDKNESLEEINKFTYSLVHNQAWGANNVRGRFDKGEGTMHFKPDLKEIEKEVGKNIIKTKLPRARAFTYVKTPNVMNNNGGLGNTGKSKKSTDSGMNSLQTMYDPNRANQFTNTHYSNQNQSSYTGINSLKK